MTSVLHTQPGLCRTWRGRIAAKIPPDQSCTSDPVAVLRAAQGHIGWRDMRRAGLYAAIAYLVDKVGLEIKMAGDRLGMDERYLYRFLAEVHEHDADQQQPDHQITRTPVGEEARRAG